MTVRKLVLMLVLQFPALTSRFPWVGQQMPPVPPELAAFRHIPLLDVTVTDPKDVRVEGAFVNYRNLRSNLGGGGQVNPSGLYVMNPQIGGSVSTGWQIMNVGPYRIQVVAKGFRTWHP